jgi:4-amino-4-deoxy-L-arabinose transferase-like glycosyltransferase
MASDEAIYSYAVERTLETGDWLTPRSILGDHPFLEKPPLKFWIVAGAMRAGILPVSDAGMRAWDALFGMIAFGYVYLLGVRLAGPICGITATLVLFAFSPLLFEHGLRSNNMEAPLVLAYCGGIFHFVRWISAERPRLRRLEALIVVLYFVLGFMSKFVAVLFLPMILGTSLLTLDGGIGILRLRWREWLGPALAVVVLVAPWFVYQSLRPAGPHAFWEVMFGVHVYQRLAGVLHPEHLAPWHAYFTWTWRELGMAHVRLLVVAGLGCLAYVAWRRSGEPGTGQQQKMTGWLARLMLLWWLLPYVVMSLGTSKLLHYAYPFIPPLALGGGLACVMALQAYRSGALGRAAARLGQPLRDRLVWADTRGAQLLLVSTGAALVLLAVWTAVDGPLVVHVDGVRVFRNSSVVRPIVVALLCLMLTRWGRRMGLSAAVAAMLILLPVDRYFENVHRILSVRHPLRTIRECAIDVRERVPGLSPGALRASGDVLHHSYYYYMRHTGAWIAADPPSNDVALARALGRDQAMPIFVTTKQYSALMRGHHARPPGVIVEEGVVALLPGPFEVCVPRVIAAGAVALN